MKLFRTKPKPEDGAEEKELVLDTENEATAAAVPEAEAKSAEPAAAATPEAAAGLEDQPPPSAAKADPLAQFRPDGPDQSAAGDEAPEGDPASPQPDDALDPDLLDIFREAKNEVEESTLASELPDIPIQDLLGDLVSISRRLGISHPASAGQEAPAPASQEDHRSSRRRLREGGK